MASHPWDGESGATSLQTEGGQVRKCAKYVNALDGPLQMTYSARRLLVGCGPLKASLARTEGFPPAVPINPPVLSNGVDISGPDGRAVLGRSC